MSVLLIALTVKYFRSQSLDAFFSDAFFFCKSAVGLLSFYMDVRILAYYLVMYLGKSCEGCVSESFEFSLPSFSINELKFQFGERERK